MTKRFRNVFQLLQEGPPVIFRERLISEYPISQYQMDTAEQMDEIKHAVHIEDISTENSGYANIYLPPIPDLFAEELEGIDTEIATQAKTGAEFRELITNLIHKMMFVSGETAEPSIDTTTLIEDITRQQVIEIVSAASMAPRTSQLTLN